MGVCRTVLQILTLFQTIKCHFPHPFSDLEGVIKRNITCLHKTAVIIADIRTPTKRFLKIHFEFAYYTCFLIHLELKRRTRSCTTVVPTTIPDSRPKQVKFVPVFRPKRLKTPSVWGNTYPYTVFIREHPPDPKRLHALSAAFPPFLLRIRNYVTDKIRNQKNIENLCGFFRRKRSRDDRFRPFVEDVFFLEIFSLFLSYIKLLI